MNNRHTCSACRLRKCFGNKMQAHLIRGPLSKQTRASRSCEPIVALMTATSNILQTESERGRLLWVNCFDLNDRECLEFLVANNESFASGDSGIVCRPMDALIKCNLQLSGTKTALHRSAISRSFTSNRNRRSSSDKGILHEDLRTLRRIHSFEQ